MIHQLLAVGSPLPIGTFIQGGYFAGYYSMSGNNIATHGLIVAPKTGGDSTGVYSNSTWSDYDARSEHDGATNTSNISSPGSAVTFCINLTLNGYSDWYLPSPLELQLAYVNFKPTTGQNDTGYDSNAYAVPQFSNAWSLTYPAQTNISTFQSTGSNAFAATRYWTSQTTGILSAYGIDFSDGRRANLNKGYSQRVRAFRKVPLGTLYS